MPPACARCARNAITMGARICSSCPALAPRPVAWPRPASARCWLPPKMWPRMLAPSAAPPAPPPPMPPSTEPSRSPSPPLPAARPTWSRCRAPNRSAAPWGCAALRPSAPSSIDSAADTALCACEGLVPNWSAICCSGAPCNCDSNSSVREAGAFMVCFQKEMRAVRLTDGGACGPTQHPLSFRAVCCEDSVTMGAFLLLPANAALPHLCHS